MPMTYGWQCPKCKRIENCYSDKELHWPCLRCRAELEKKYHDLAFWKRADGSVVVTHIAQPKEVPGNLDYSCWKYVIDPKKVYLNADLSFSEVHIVIHALLAAGFKPKNLRDYEPADRNLQTIYEQEWTR